MLENSAKGPVLVNFWTAKAGPCLRLYPVLDKLVHDYGGKFLLVNLNADDQRTVAKEYGVISVPTMKLFRGGQVAGTLRGYQSEKELRAFIDPYVVPDSELQLARAVRLCAQGKTDQAFTVLAQAAMDDPANLRIPEVIAKLLIREDRTEEAYRLLRTLPESSQREPGIAALLARLAGARPPGC